jgi:predicted RNase H-like nuclease (RuvC/YqgF family)
LRQSNAQWQSKFQAERSARQQAERRAEAYRTQINQLQQENQVLKSHLNASDKETDTLRADLRQLESLKAWAGHPFSVCHKLMSGSIDRTLAEQMMKDLAHKNCLKKQGSGIGKVLLAGGALLSLSQLGKR